MYHKDDFYEVDEEGNIIHDAPVRKEYLTTEEQYDYGFNSSLKDESKDNEGWWSGVWGNYQDTGVWKGYNYYQKSTLDYKYIEQMANIFAGKYNVKVDSGNFWAVDIGKQELIYNPVDLMTGTKANLIASLLHEIGHIKYTTAPEKWVSPFLKKETQNTVKEVVNVFEDLRIDKIMAKAYGGAEDIYKAIIPIAKELAKKMSMQSRQTEEMNQYLQLKYDELKKLCVEKLLEETLESQDSNQEKLNKDVNKLNEDLKPLEELLAEIQNNSKKTVLHDYCSAMLLLGYGEKIKVNDDVQEKINKTKHAIDLCVKAKSTDALIKILDTEVFPVIEDFLDIFNIVKNISKKPQMKNASPLVKAIAQHLEEYSKELSQNYSQNQNNGSSPTEQVRVMGKNGSYKNEEQLKSRETRASGGKRQIPKEWATGDYKALKDSVATGVKDLIRKMTMFRRNEQTIRWRPNQRRGKLNSKNLFSYRLGNPRLFKKKTETTDTLLNFAFSIMVDVSGSMSGDVIINATRGAVLFAEVLDKLKIPYELLTYDTNSRIIKDFDTRMNLALQKQVGGLVRCHGGGTTLACIKNATKITDRIERNKIAVILSDGDLYDATESIEMMKEWKKKNVVTLGIGIGISDCCRGKDIFKENWSEVPNPMKLPQTFVDILKKYIKL